MDDYYNTAQRMWADGNVLYNQNRWFGTCYLTGYVLECYGKVILKNYTTYDVSTYYKHNLSRMNRDIQTLSNTIAKYCIDMHSDCQTICVGSQKWHPNDRYNCSTGFWDSDTVAKNYINESKKVLEMVTKMKLDGVI